MSELKRQEEFKDLAHQLHDGLENGIETFDLEGDNARFYFDSTDIETVVHTSPDIPGFVDYISMDEFTGIYAEQLHKLGKERRDSFFDDEVSVLGAALTAYRRHRLANASYSMAVVTRQKEPALGVPLDKHPSSSDFAIKSVEQEVAAVRADAEFSRLYEALAVAVKTQIPQEATA